jgi:hypothetical protein
VHLNGPWISGANKSPRDVLMTVIDALQEKDEDDKLFVFPVQMGEISTGRKPKRPPIQGLKGDRVIAVDYTLHYPAGPDGKADYERRRKAVIRKLKRLGATCHPLDSLWLVKTNLSAHEVHLAIEKAARLDPDDEFMVADVDLEARMNGCPVKGAEEGLNPQVHNWLLEAGVL